MAIYSAVSVAVILMSTLYTLMWALQSIREQCFVHDTDSADRMKTILNFVKMVRREMLETFLNDLTKRMPWLVYAFIKIKDISKDDSKYHILLNS